MPVEIKELVIRVTTDGGGQGAAPASTSDDRDRVVQECVREVLRILRKTKER